MSKSSGASATRCATTVWIAPSPTGRKKIAQRFIAGFTPPNQNESRRDERKEYHALVHQLSNALRVGHQGTPFAYQVRSPTTAMDLPMWYSACDINECVGCGLRERT